MQGKYDSFLFGAFQRHRHICMYIKIIGILTILDRGASFISLINSNLNIASETRILQFLTIFFFLFGWKCWKR